jgi:hypothetical protein
MDPFGFNRLIADKWDIVMMYPGLFAAVFGLGFLVGIAVTRIFLNERLVGQQNDIAKLRAILEEKLPASFLPTSKRSRPMSFPFILGGLGLALIGIAIAIGGVLWTMRSGSSVSVAAPPTNTALLQSAITTNVPKIQTAAIDVPKKIEAIDELLDIFDKEWDPWMNLCQQLSTGGWRNQIVGKKIKELRDSIYKMSNDYYGTSRKIEALNKRNERFPDIHALTTQPYIEKFKPPLDSFVKVFGSLSDPMGNALDQVTLENVFEKYATDLYAQSQTANNWRLLTARSALEIRKSLSQ